MFKTQFHQGADWKEDVRNGRAYSLVLSSRTSEDLDISNTHGWYGIAYPTKEETYVILHVGKFASYFPSTCWGTFTFVGNTYDAVVAINDDNHTYSMRQITYHVTQLDRYGAQQTFERLKQKIKKAREKRLVFQIGGKGCAGFAESSNKKSREWSNHNPLNAFQCHVAKAEPHNLLFKTIQKIISVCRPCLQKWVFRFLMSVVVPWRSIKIQNKTFSLTRMKVWKTLIMSHPAYLHQQQIEEMTKYARGEISWDDAVHLNHWDEASLKQEKFIGFLQKVYNREKKAKV